MMSDGMEKIATIAIAIVGVATLAVLVSKRADTSNVIKSAGAAFSNALSVAVSPVTGSSGGGLGGNGFVSPF
jgi:membrane DNA delivery protein